MNLFVWIIRGGGEECKTELGELDALVILCSLDTLFSQVTENMPVGAAEECDPLMCHLCFWCHLDKLQCFPTVEGQEKSLLCEMVGGVLRITSLK